MNIKTKPCVRKSEILTQHIAGETLVYDLQKNKAYCLNETSSLIWQMCDGTKTVSEIASQLGKKLKSFVSEDVVWLAIDQFKKDGLLGDNSIRIARFSGMSRREVIKKVGMASAIALPIVSSLVVPTAASAQSGCVPNGQPCDINGSPCCPNSFCLPDSPGFSFGTCFPNIPI